MRQERRITRHHLAAEAGVSPSQILRAENGQDIRFSTLLKIFSGLGYRLEFDLQETSEEIGGLLSEESWRRELRREEGMLKGKRWR